MAMVSRHSLERKYCSDNNGANCAKNQADPVWFLTGSITGKAERTCNIPARKAILFTILKYFNSQIDKNVENLFELGLSDLHY